MSFAGSKVGGTKITMTGSGFEGTVDDIYVDLGVSMQPIFFLCIHDLVHILNNDKLVSNIRLKNKIYKSISM